MKLIARLRRFARASSGLAALEFALLAPIMLTLLFGSIETIDALGANRRVQNVAASLADVIARDNSVSEDEITGLWAALDILMFPEDGAGMGVTVSSISIDADLNANVEWSRAYNGYAPAAVVVPAAMRRAGTSLIVAQVNYRYNSPISFLIDALGFDMRHTVFRRSRLVDPIPCEWEGCS